jgi:hypothetical protein
MRPNRTLRRALRAVGASSGSSSSTGTSANGARPGPPIYDEQNADGKRKQVWRGGFRTKEAAEQFLTDTLGKLDRGDYVPPSKVTVGEYVDTWSDGLSITLSSLTVHAYRGTVKHHRSPALDHLQLQRLTTGHVNALYAKLAEKGLEPATIARIHAVLHVALDDAVRDRLVPRNVADGAKKPRIRIKRQRTWSARELRTFLESTETTGCTPATCSWR